MFPVNLLINLYNAGHSEYQQLEGQGGERGESLREKSQDIEGPRKKALQGADHNSYLMFKTKYKDRNMSS